ncbi:MAG: cytochrome c [Acidobacteriia bacterium]|nr:cytochrome c [Terriglobia bacterium]MYG01534.1 cytochrome c [Terriglobia bacterium]MYK11643.1 cytochrome c [Terriglobia bacterium]
MRVSFSGLGSLAVLIAPFVGTAQAAELPPVGELHRLLGSAAKTVLVYEPHLSVGDRHVEIEYVGYQANDVMARLFGEDWQGQTSTIEFRALDGYVSHIDVSRFMEESAYLVFGREDGAPFTVDNVEQNQMGVPLGPYYLVWDNISSPALVLEGTRNWPYQVRAVRLVTLSDEALVPTGLDARLHEGAELVKTHCLSCHEVNGFGGAKFEGNLAEIVKDYEEADFLRLVLTPASERIGATMPALSDRLSEGERRRIADAVFDYLKAVPVERSRPIE